MENLPPPGLMGMAEAQRLTLATTAPPRETSEIRTVGSIARTSAKTAAAAGTQNS